MEHPFKEWLKNVIKFLTNRLFVLFIGFCVMFYILSLRLFDLQIVNGARYQAEIKTPKAKTVSIAAPRGGIYDRYGRPLAVNEVAFTIKIDPNLVDFKTYTPVIISFVELMKKNDERLIDTFPISIEKPYSFTTFNGSRTREERWKEDMGIPIELNAQQSFEKLRNDIFKIPTQMSDAEARDVLNVLTAVYLQRFNLNIVTVSEGVKNVTVAALEERNQDFPGIGIDVSYLRTYPQGENFSHMLGYIRGINETELEAYKGLDMGYDANSIVGKDGIEKYFELELKGSDGQREVKVDSTTGRIVSTSDNENTIKPVAGNDIILTIDADLQNKSAEILKNKIKEIMINKISGVAAKEEPYTAKEVLASMLRANNISLSTIMESEEGSYSYSIKRELLGADLDETAEDYKTQLMDTASKYIESGQISVASLMLALYEQQIITLTDTQINQLSRNNSMVTKLILEKLQNDEITPQMINLDPSTGSAVVVDVNTGDVLAAVNYPTYDNNKFVNNFNNAYFNKLNNDPTTPMYNLAFQGAYAPGSTFKMIMALAGLDTGAITENTKIQDRGTFMEAGFPYARCWNRVAPYHGPVDVKKALEVSCNYFFYTVSYMFGNSKEGNMEEGIATMNKYMAMFGLDQRAGVEIFEYYDFSYIPEEQYARISSPEYLTSRNSQEKWTDGQTIRTAIGQSKNNYTAANMAKYIATLANGGTRYQLHLLDKIVSGSGEVLEEFVPNVELQLDFKQEYFDIVYEGMLSVTQGSSGTARAVFRDFPINVAGKTGTAQEAEYPSHASFAGFAPYEDPQVAVYVIIPYGDTLTTLTPAAQVCKEIMGYYLGVDRQPQTTEMNNTLAK